MRENIKFEQLLYIFNIANFRKAKLLGRYNIYRAICWLMFFIYSLFTQLFFKLINSDFRVNLWFVF